MMTEWASQYQDTTPTGTISPDVHLASYLLDPASPSGARGTGPLFTYRGAVTSAAAARQRVLHLSHALSSTINLSPGARVATLALATPAHLETLLAITAAGGVAAPLNWRWSADETAYALNLIGAEALAADKENLALALAAAAQCPSLRALVVLGVPQSTLLDALLLGKLNQAHLELFWAENVAERGAASVLAPSPLLQRPADGAAFIIFTSGTTGPPRAAVLSHAALHFQCWAKMACCGYNTNDIYLHAAQLFHVGGLCSALAMLRVGARHVFLPIFKAEESLEAIAAHSVTSMIAVPTMAADLVAAAAKRGRNESFLSVRTVLVGAGGLAPPLARSLAALLPSAALHTAYGMTEACSSLTFATIGNDSQPRPPAAAAARGGVLVGVPPPGIELGVIPLSDSPEGNISSSDDSIVQIKDQGYGEVVTRGPHVMLRYWKDPAATAASFLPGGWLRTGDLGVLAPTAVLPSFANSSAASGGGNLKQQACALWLVGRAKDVVKSGGENVAAAEVERALLKHPGVAAAAVIGLPDLRLGERVAAAVVAAPGWRWEGPPFQTLGFSSSEATKDREIPGNAIDAALLQRHCRAAGLAGFKLPRTVACVAELPVNATGKVLKPQVRQRLEQMAAAAAAPPRPRL